MRNQDDFRAIDDSYAEVPTIGQMAQAVWRARWLVLLITILAGALSLSINLLNATYQSQGFFQFGGPIPLQIEKTVRDQARGEERGGENNGDRKRDRDKDNESGRGQIGISLANFKRYASAYATREQFTEFVREKKLEAAPGVSDLQAMFASRGGLGRAVDPVYSFTKLDAKELMDQPKDGGNNVLGLQITYSSKSPELAQKTVDLLGRYAMDSIVYSIYADELRAKEDETRNKIANLDNEIIGARVQLQEQQEKIADLKQIIERNPAAARENSRQVVEVSESTSHFLPLATQLTTAEVRASNVNQLIAKSKREHLQKTLLLEYYERAKTSLNRSRSGETVLRSLEGVKTEVFKGKNLQDDAIKEVFNIISAHNQSAVNLYFDRTRFVAGPTLPQHSSARPSIALGLGLLGGLLIALVLVYFRARLRNADVKS